MKVAELISPMAAPTTIRIYKHASGKDIYTGTVYYLCFCDDYDELRQDLCNMYVLSIESEDKNVIKIGV